MSWRKQPAPPVWPSSWRCAGSGNCRRPPASLNGRPQLRANPREPTSTERADAEFMLNGAWANGPEPENQAALLGNATQHRDPAGSRQRDCRMGRFRLGQPVGQPATAAGCHQLPACRRPGRPGELAPQPACSTVGRLRARPADAKLLPAAGVLARPATPGERGCP